MDEKKKSSEKTQLKFNLNLDNTSILYTDNVFINANQDGVTLNVGQKIFNTDQIRIVSRIGMSRNHAKKLVAELSKLLAITEEHIHASKKKN